MNEVWRDIEGYEGLYQVSDHGQVKSLRYDKIMKPVLNEVNGYLRVMMTGKEGRKNEYIHKLVAKTFIPNPHNLPEVNHKCEDRLDNRVSQIEWCNRAYNCNYGNRVKGSKKVKPVAIVSDSGTIQKVFKNATEAERETGVERRLIGFCCQGRTKTAGGLKWRYLEVKQDE